MMTLDFMEEFSGSNDQTIAKGKRTKRLKSSSSTSNSLVSSPATSSGISTTTEEDEDMANCLILLARGNSPPQIEEPKKTVGPAAAESKFSSRRFTEMATTTSGKVGIFVYECKTCNRTFPSFQALGGHRASHKKPKTTADDDQQRSPTAAPPPLPDNQEEEGRSPSLHPVQMISKNCHNDQNKPKIHSCSICGSEFASGQALGGHMRRHRRAPSTCTRIGNSADSDMTSHDGSDEKPRNMLELDLNLPAPPEDEKLQQFPAKQQQHLSSPPRRWCIATIR